MWDNGGPPSLRSPSQKYWHAKGYFYKGFPKSLRAGCNGRLATQTSKAPKARITYFDLHRWHWEYRHSTRGFPRRVFLWQAFQHKIPERTFWMILVLTFLHQGFWTESKLRFQTGRFPRTWAWAPARDSPHTFYTGSAGCLCWSQTSSRVQQGM